jgi:signal peptidase I
LLTGSAPMIKRQPPKPPRSDSPGVPVETASSSRVSREVIESVVIAFVLAFLFRTFEAEAFVIPTGSMAPTLLGQHLDVNCPQCGVPYRVGVGDHRPNGVTCPICNHFRHGVSDLPVYSGDRILVDKTIYELSDPQRWDPLVFKFPGDGKMNYIKRLVGLPGEVLQIRNGEVYVGPRVDQLSIARKPPHKVKAMLQNVDDNRYIPEGLERAGWPRRWQVADGDQRGWTEQIAHVSDKHVDTVQGQRIEQSFQFNDRGQTPAWIRYHHFVPPSDWSSRVPIGQLPAPRPQVVTDKYAYNPERRRDHEDNWVGDLAVEAEVEIHESRGELLLELFEGRTPGGAGGSFVFRAAIDLQTGQARLSITGPGGARPFDANAQGEQVTQPVGQTPLNKPGRYRIRFANVDDQLLLWVNAAPNSWLLENRNDRVVEFDSPTTYSPLNNQQETADDTAPIRLGAAGAQLTVHHLRVRRDIYYLDKFEPQLDEQRNWDKLPTVDEVVTITLGPDEFFMLGDNSPFSQDSRTWWGKLKGLQPTVERRHLIGKALYIYWNRSLLSPDFDRFSLVR